MLVIIYQTTRWIDPNNHNLNSRCRESFESNKYLSNSICQTRIQPHRLRQHGNRDNFNIIYELETSVIDSSVSDSITAFNLKSGNWLGSQNVTDNSILRLRYISSSTFFPHESSWHLCDVGCSEPQRLFHPGTCKSSVSPLSPKWGNNNGHWLHKSRFFICSLVTKPPTLLNWVYLVHSVGYIYSSCWLYCHV